MKKTLTLLLAATGCAMASYTEYTETGTQIDINSLGSDYLHSGKATTKNVTLVFNVNVSDILSENNRGVYETAPQLISLSGKTNQNRTYNLGLSIGFRSPSASSITIHQYNDSTNWDKYVTLPSNANYYTIVLTSYEFNNKSTYWCPTLYAWTVLNDGTLKHEIANASWNTSKVKTDITLNFNTDLVDSVYVYNSVLTGDDMLAAAETAVKNNLNVPEPTTATLSLLALAGLAARRRRA